MINLTRLSECRSLFLTDGDGKYYCASGDEHEFDKFRQVRPEAAVLDLAFEDSKDDLITLYEKLIAGCALLRARRMATDNHPYDEQKCIAHIHKVLTALSNTDFFVAPASTVYHDAYPSGLLEHSLRVAKFAARLYYSKLFPVTDSYSIADAVLIALVHDWCKINMYESYIKNVKNDKTGAWEQVTAYRIADQKYTSFGHGVSSMFMAMKFFKLSEEESLAIRWHMGEYNVADNEMNDLHYANENYPLVFLLQFADRLAVTNYAK